MLEFLKKLLIGHSHHWEIIRKGTLVDGKIAVGSYYHSQCKICGKLKVNNFY
jgi:predicted restriction endonuclease